MSIKALVVDDSVVYRKNLAKILAAIPGIEEVCQASHGKEAVRICEKEHFDIITLDVEMPLMSGIEALPKILEALPEAKVLMVSSITKTGAEHTMKALNLGAKDFVTKEQAFGLMESEAEALKREVTSKISSFLGVDYEAPAAAPTLIKKRISFAPKTVAPIEIKKLPPAPPSQVDLLLVGSSTGGPNALQELFRGMKKNREYAIVVVQHMPPLFTSQLAKNLMRVTGHVALESAEGHILKKGEIVIAAGGKHLELVREGNNWVCRHNEKPPVNYCRPSVDATFFSVAKALKGRQAVAIVLTGMGADGAEGCVALHDKGIPILTQSKDSCVVYGMPKAVDEKGVSRHQLAPTFLISGAEKYMIRAEAAKTR